jgi:hypothetical protein
VTPARCRRDQLRAQFGEGGNGTGSDFAGILIRNVSEAPCSVKGRLAFTAYSAVGIRDANTSIAQPRSPRTYVLPAKVARYTRQRNPRGYLDALLMGQERDDPTQPNAVCRTKDERAPAVLVIRIGLLRFRVTNDGPRSDYPQPNSPRPGAVYGCHGIIQFNALIPPEAL